MSLLLKHADKYTFEKDGPESDTTDIEHHELYCEGGPACEIKHVPALRGHDSIKACKSFKAFIKGLKH